MINQYDLLIKRKITAGGEFKVTCSINKKTPPKERKEEPLAEHIAQARRREDSLRRGIYYGAG